MGKHGIFISPPKEAIDFKKWTEIITSALEILYLNWQFGMGAEKEIRHPSIHLFSYPLIQQIIMESLLCIRHCTRPSASICFPVSCCLILFLINASSFIHLCKCWQEWVKNSLLVRASLCKIDADDIASFRMLTALSTPQFFLRFWKTIEHSGWEHTNRHKYSVAAFQMPRWQTANYMFPKFTVYSNHYLSIHSFHHLLWVRLCMTALNLWLDTSCAMVQSYIELIICQHCSTCFTYINSVGLHNTFINYVLVFSLLQTRKLRHRLFFLFFFFLPNVSWMH